MSRYWTTIIKVKNFSSRWYCPLRWIQTSHQMMKRLNYASIITSICSSLEHKCAFAVWIPNETMALKCSKHILSSLSNWLGPSGFHKRGIKRATEDVEEVTDFYHISAYTPKLLHYNWWRNLSRIDSSQGLLCQLPRGRKNAGVPSNLLFLHSWIKPATGSLPCTWPKRVVSKLNMHTLFIVMTPSNEVQLLLRWHLHSGRHLRWYRQKI